ncbi:hypothetical protein [Agromyces larvae]|uniref:Uncharacterized protein n=1 Tax=Agromyces larvae TaxID=2929802 RepID=A0ABY4BXT4_9MICO|nr:hypothetical protein [Agromyces larvae]UOE43007.1 hypothetical protein MTO99_12500 [Agromyces larvae]
MSTLDELSRPIVPEIGAPLSTLTGLLAVATAVAAFSQGWEFAAALPVLMLVLVLVLVLALPAWNRRERAKHGPTNRRVAAAIVAVAVIVPLVALVVAAIEPQLQWLLYVALVVNIGLTIGSVIAAVRGSENRSTET